MTETINPSYLPAFDLPERETIGNTLQATLIDLVDLSLIGKQLHWSVQGPRFHPLHLQLDELVESWRGLADTVAERAVALGFFPDGQAETLATSSQLTYFERGPIDDSDVVHALTVCLVDASRRTRDRMESLGELDAASQDVLIEVLRALEQQLWMVRAQLPSIVD
jgi:starvation-inducible DNA-binding protein